VVGWWKSSESEFVWNQVTPKSIGWSPASLSDQGTTWPFWDIPPVLVNRGLDASGSSGSKNDNPCCLESEMLANQSRIFGGRNVMLEYRFQVFLGLVWNQH
jgi:hypothetical protein